MDHILKLSKRVFDKERRLQIGDGGTYTGYVPPPPPPPPTYYPPQPPLPTFLGGNLLHPLKTRVPMRPLSSGYGANNVPSSDALDRKFAAADIDGDGYVDASEAADFVRYHERADLDGDGDVPIYKMAQLPKSNALCSLSPQAVAQVRSRWRRWCNGFVRWKHSYTARARSNNVVSRRCTRSRTSYGPTQL